MEVLSVVNIQINGNTYEDTFPWRHRSKTEPVFLSPNEEASSSLLLSSASLTSRDTKNVYYCILKVTARSEEVKKKDKYS